MVNYWNIFGLREEELSFGGSSFLVEFKRLKEGLFGITMLVLLII
jgi:hypothetical protein